MAGLTVEGFVIATLEEILEDIKVRLRDLFGSGLPLGADTIEGQTIAIVAEAIAKLWELGEAINSSQDPDKATGAALDALAALTGTTREPPKFGTVVLTLTGTPATVVPAGSQAGKEINDTGDLRFAIDSDVVTTIVATDAWAPTTAYITNDRVTNAGNVYLALNNGTSAGSVGPVHTDRDDSPVDGTVAWLWLGEGTGDVDANATAIITGPHEAPAQSVVIIETAVAGWLGVVNLSDANPGADLQTDEDLRIARVADLARPGSSTARAIRADLLALEDVTSVTVFVNNTSSVVDGMPPHSVEALVRGGDNQDIFNALLASVAAGIETTGNTAGTATDSEGIEHAEKFSRPTEILIHARAHITKDPDLYPLDGDDAAREAIVDYGDAQDTGKDAVPSRLIAAVHTVTGVLDVTAMMVYTDDIAAPVAWAPTTAYVATPGARSVVSNNGRFYICITSGTSAGSGGPLTTADDITDGTAHWRHLGNTVAIAPRELAVFDTSRIDITSIDGTP